MPKKRKVGRPEREYDKKTFETLCEVQCTVDEIESILHTNQATIDKWCLKVYKENFCTIYKRYASNGKQSLRRYQFAQAKRSATMAIWLGKNWLGQSDRIEQLEEHMKTVLTVFNDINRLVNKDDRTDTEATPIDPKL